MIQFFSVPFVKGVVSSVYASDPFVKNGAAVTAWIYLWGLCSLPRAYVPFFVCVPVLCICYYGSIIYFEIWYCNITISSTLPILLKADLDISYFFNGFGLQYEFSINSLVL